MRWAALVPMLISVSCAGTDEPAPVRAYSIDLSVDDSAERYRYVSTEVVDIRVGDEVTFELANTGTLIHDLQVVDPAGATIATAQPVAPGQTTMVTTRFDEPGFYRLDCLVDDHLTVHEMQTFVEVTDPDA